MNNVVNKLLDMDKKARQTLDEARQYYEKTIEEITLERARLLEDYSARAKAHIDDVANMEAAAIADAAAAVNSAKSEKIQFIQDRYNQNHSAWEEEIFGRCVKKVRCSD